MNFLAIFLFLVPQLIFASSLFVILLGAPGSGKGTQAQLLSEKFHLPHISVGDLLRISIQENTELGLAAKVFVDRGDLVPDDLVLNMLAERISQPDCEQGAILDGTSRKPSQAEYLFKLLANDQAIAIYFEIPNASLYERIEGRKCCHKCGAIFHNKFYMEKEEGICDRCTSPLFKREDDTSEVLKNRLKGFDQQIDLVLSFYKNKNILYKINAYQPIEQVNLEIVQLLENYIPFVNEKFECKKF